MAIVEIAPGAWVEEDQLRFSYCRSSGPGGQNVNKVNTKAELRVALAALRGLSERTRARLAQLAGSRLTNQGELILTCEVSRSQESNRDTALLKLRELLVRAQHQPKPRKATRPSAGARRRRLESKRIRSQIKAGRNEPRE
jgi:ribosome-associated protein